MEVDRELINPEFECYKLSLDDSAFIVDYFPLISKCKGEETDGNVEFQVLADDIYENKLKRSGDKFYYLNQENDLVCISNGTISMYPGPFECFGVAKDHDVIICVSNFDLIIIKSGKSRTESLPFKSRCFKILEVKLIKSSIHLILQKLSKVKDMRKGEKYSKLLDKTAFCFYNVVIEDEDSFKCDLIGWSLSRPLVSFIRDSGEIILGTSTTGIIYLENSEKLEDTEEEYHSDSDSEGEDSSNGCLVTEFNNNNNIQYPELRISGSSVNDLQLAIKYLDDVIILNLISTGKTKHLTTFPALNFIQSGKIDKKFCVFGKEFAFVIEASGNIFIYSKPGDLKSQRTSFQYLAQLNEEVYGWAHEIEGERDTKETLFILTKENFYKLKMK